MSFFRSQKRKCVVCSEIIKESINRKYCDFCHKNVYLPKRKALIRELVRKYDYEVYHGRRTPVPRTHWLIEVKPLKNPAKILAFIFLFLFLFRPVFALNDLSIADFNSISALTPFSNIDFNASLKNNGDTNMVGILWLKINSTPVNSIPISVNANGRQDYNISWLNGSLSTVGGAYSVMVYLSDLNADVNSANDYLTKSVIIAGSADLIVQGVSVSSYYPFDNNLFSFTATIKNQGTSPTGQFYTYAYLGGSKIAEKFINSLNANASINWDYNWVISISGTKTFEIYTDVNNLVGESIETNNQYSVNLTNYIDANSFSTNQVSNISGYPLTFEISRECFANISNGDRFIIDSFSYDVNLQSSKAIFKWTDSVGNVFASGVLDENYLKVLNSGRTIRVLDISQSVVRLLLIYQQPYSIAYTSCDLDTTKIKADKQLIEQENTTLKNNVLNVQSNLTAKENQLTELNQKVISCSTELERTKNDLRLKNLDFSNYITEADARISRIDQEAKTKYNDTISFKDNEVAQCVSQNNFYFIFIILALIAIGAVGILFIVATIKRRNGV